MRDSVSPDSSRELSPSYEHGYNRVSRRFPAASNSIAELSEHFDLHSLTPRRPSIPRDVLTPRAREHNPSLHSPTSFSNRVCRQRRSMNRLRSSSTHLSRISALVEDMVQTGLPTYDPTHPTSMLNDSTSPSLSPDEQLPSATSYFGFTPIPPSSISATGSHSFSLQHSLRRAQSYKIDKDLRHSASREGTGSNTRLVKKKVRMRKSSKSLSSGAGKRRE